MVQNACIYNMVPIISTGKKHCMKRLKFALVCKYVINALAI